MKRREIVKLFPFAKDVYTNKQNWKIRTIMPVAEAQAILDQNGIKGWVRVAVTWLYNRPCEYTDVIIPRPGHEDTYTPRLVQPPAPRPRPPFMDWILAEQAKRGGHA